MNILQYLDAFKIKISINNDCWEWNGSLDKDGYGLFHADILVRAHRFAYKVYIDDTITSDDMVHHKCENKKCVNPEHLTTLTRSAHSKLHGAEWSFHRGQTHCLNGHEYTVDNTLFNPDSSRYCRICNIKRKRLSLGDKWNGSFQGFRSNYCIRGHELVEENIYIRPSGVKQCKVCRRRTDQLRYGSEVYISYLVSTYNSGHFLEQHISNLIEKQTNPNFEIIICDTNSTGTDKFVSEKWLHMDDRISYIWWPEREPYGVAWLRCWSLARGKFVVNSNTDDFHAPNFTESFYKYMSLATGPMKRIDKIGFGYAGITVIDEQHKILGQGVKPPFDFEEYSHTCHGGPQLCWRNDDGFKKELDWQLMWKRAHDYRSAFDYWFILYLMSLGFHGHVIPELLTIYTQRPDSIENSNKWANNWETYAAISEFFPHNFPGHLKHAREFSDFQDLPPKDQWVDIMQRGKKWKTKKK